VGKTCLSYRFCNGRFPGPTEATIGVDFRERSIIIDEELIRIQLVFFEIFFGKGIPLNFPVKYRFSLDIPHPPTTNRVH